VTLGVVDSHHHLWDPQRRSYAFLDPPECEPIRRTFGPSELTAAATPNGVVQTVLVQAAPDLSETEELFELAASTPLVGAVVGWIDFEAPDPASQLDGLLAHPDSGLLAGIRAMAEDQPDPDWLAGAPVTRAAQAVGAAGLACDLLVTPREIPAACTLVNRLPGVQFVIDHAGKPPIESGSREPWQRMIADLASAPNTACKVSGLITESGWDSWTAARIRPFVETVVEAFGEDRLLFGSDWPVCLLAGGYSEVLALARDTLDQVCAEKVFAANARHIYRLAEPPAIPGTSSPGT
jgi:L-fuconolactonase